MTKNYCRLLGYTTGYLTNNNLTKIKEPNICKASKELYDTKEEERLKYCTTEFFTQCPRYIKYIKQQ